MGCRNAERDVVTCVLKYTDRRACAGDCVLKYTDRRACAGDCVLKYTCRRFLPHVRRTPTHPPTHPPLNGDLPTLLPIYPYPPTGTPVPTYLYLHLFGPPAIFARVVNSGAKACERVNGLQERGA